MSARELFDSLKDWASIEALLATQRPESLLLDYKSAFKAGATKAGEDYAFKVFSKPITSLANDSSL